jgi:predicted lactoylglutathione lyase
VVEPILSVITLGARDFGSLRDFYKRLGWNAAIDLDDFCAFETRGAVLSLFPVDKLAAEADVEPGPATQGLSVSLAINVDEADKVDEIIEAVREAGGRITSEPSKPPQFEGRHAHFADPEDNYWEVVWLGNEQSKMTELVKRARGES